MDLISPSVISVGATSPNPGLMVLFPNKRFTLVFSAYEQLPYRGQQCHPKQVAQNSGRESLHITLPGFTESMVVAPDNATGFAAVPTRRAR